MTKARDLADGVINTSELADGSITTAKIADGDITDAKLATGISASKLSGALPAISGAALTGISAGLSGPNKEIFTSSGTFTVPAGVTSVKVTVVGGGASGGVQRSGRRRQVPAGGGGGGTAIKWITGLTAGDTVAVTVGAGGAGTTTAPYYTNGGTSSFGAYCSATGGQGRENTSTLDSHGMGLWSMGGEGGTATGGDLNIKGGQGGNGYVPIGEVNTSGYISGGAGGCPMGISGNINSIVVQTTGNLYISAYYYVEAPVGPFGGNAGQHKLAGSGSSTEGNHATGYGCGGSGFSYVNPTTFPAGVGGDGYQGVVIVEY